MLHEGKIVDRGSPADLITRYGRHTLEEVFLDIARDRRSAGNYRDAGDGKDGNVLPAAR